MGFDRGQDGFEVVAQHGPGKGRYIEARRVFLVGLPDFVQAGKNVLQNGQAVGPPGGFFVPRPGHQIDDDRAQNLGRPAPVYIVQGLEHLVGEIEGVAIAGKIKIGGRGENEVRDGVGGMAAVVQGQ